jgi:hypothetical protein
MQFVPTLNLFYFLLVQFHNVIAVFNPPFERSEGVAETKLKGRVRQI